MKHLSPAVIALLLAVAAGLPGQARAGTVTVTANTDLYIAAGGGYDGATPIGIDVTGATSITFAASPGATLTVNNGNYNDADGIGSVSGEHNTGTAVISGITAPTAGFIAGVFYLAAAPLPAALDFIGNTSFASLSPALNQAFFIGDGLTGDATGATQTFYVPTGATTLYLGLTDACGYSGGPSCYGDNFGSFTVTYTTAGTDEPTPTPEPASLALLASAVAGLLLLRLLTAPGRGSARVGA